ncbi:MAG: hypothetical protein SF162_01200 [bacterium]|nr:hypothetical protein [bacterium]
MASMPTPEQYLSSLVRSDNALLLVAVLIAGALLLLRLFPVAAGLKITMPSMRIPMFRVSDQIAAGAVAIVSVVARLPLLDQSLWYDEAYSLVTSSLPAMDFIQAVARDVHPPSYYLLMRSWQSLLGGGNLAVELLRLPSVGFGLVCVWLMYEAARSLNLSKATGLVAAGLMAIAPNAIYYSSELRIYSAFIAAVLLAIILYQRQSRWFPVLIAVLPWLHQMGLLYASVMGLYALWRPPHRARKNILAGLCVGLMIVPLTLLQSGVISDGYWLQESPGQIVYVYLSVLFRFLPDGAGWLLIPSIAFVLLVIMNSAWLWRTIVAPILFVVPLCAALITIIGLPVLLPRALLPSAILLILPIAKLIASSRNNLLWATATLALIVPGMAYAVSTDLRPDYRTAWVDGCQGMDSAYATSINMAFIARQFTDNVEVWNEAVDDGGTFHVRDLPVWGFTVVDTPTLPTCLLYANNPRAEIAERQYVQLLVNMQNDSMGALIITNDSYHIHAWRLVDAR